MDKDLRESFQEASRNLTLLPLLKKQDLEKFQVDYGNEVIDELISLVEEAKNDNGKIIFTGHRGCGKSTLLAKFRQLIIDEYFTVFFSISDIIEMSDVNHINILFAIGVQLMAEAEAQNIEISESIKQQFYKWFASHTRIIQEDLKTSGSLGINLFEIITGKLQADKTVRDEIKQTFLRDISKLISRINEIAATISSVSNKKIIVIIDDLDKLDLAVVREIYKDNIKALFQPSFMIIFSIPIAAYREVDLKDAMETETNDRIIPMPVYKIFNKGESRKENAVTIPQTNETLLNVLNKRISTDLIEDETAKEIILYSGGVLREVIRIANGCCRICLQLLRKNTDNKDIKINYEVLKEAIKKLRLDFSIRLGKADYEILEKTYQVFNPDDPKDQKFLDLLHGLYVLEYRNDELWYDVHPIVIELLKRRQES
ncbi:ATP-binding protein [Crocosphaera sp. UHCC 0190]|uniref:ATP-binding protein n=1 Tax=Crocosphaera sp. UHCC 0190 TaxID=3110246 RepID=UPI002B1F1F52|nr:ATP-binding protein [Crocosphaera sp. UHCC 0190]MEA5509279.1 ATP-binding protein [Crocosphaera sp. UHCC 0190]